MLDTKKIRNKALIFLLSYWSVFSLNQLIDMMSMTAVYNGVTSFGYNILPLFIFAFCAKLLFSFFQNKGGQIRACILGGCASILCVWGTYVHFVNDLFGVQGESLKCLNMILGLSCFTVPFFHALMDYMERISNYFEEKKENKLFRYEVFYAKHKYCYFGTMFFVILLSFIPVFLSNWPGNFVFDAPYQMTEVLTEQYSTHHPLIHTLLMGKAYLWGSKIGSVSLGYSVYTIVQMVIMAFSMAYLMYFLFDNKVHRTIRVGTLAFYIVFPIHKLFAISATKDVLCAGFFLMFMVEIFRFIFGNQRNRKYLVRLVLFGALTSLFRNNMLYAIVVAMLLVVIMEKNKRKRIAVFVCLILMIGVTKIVNYSLVRATSAVDNDSSRESMSVPLQCLARVAAYRREELDPVLYEEIISYIRESDLSGYNPYNSDAVKNNANERLLNGNFVNFMKLFIKVGIKFPGEYMESILTNTMGYWYPLNQGMYVSADISTYHMLIGMGEEIDKQGYGPGFVQNYYMDMYYKNEYHETPVLGYLFRNAIHVWFLMISFVYVLSKRKMSSIQLLLFPVMYLMTCFLGPMAALRYIYSLIIIEPLVFMNLLNGNTSGTTEIITDEKVKKRVDF